MDVLEWNSEPRPATSPSVAYLINSARLKVSFSIILITWVASDGAR